MAGTVTRFGYGADGSRAWKQSGTTASFYFGAEADLTETPGLSTLTLYPHPDIKISNGAVQVLHRDHLTSVRVVTGADGARVERTDYAAYGERTNDGMETSKSYIGERHDAETGLQYLNFRYMDPVFGRFISPDNWDPRLPGVGTNRYAYALNNNLLSLFGVARAGLGRIGAPRRKSATVGAPGG